MTLLHKLRFKKILAPFCVLLLKENAEEKRSDNLLINFVLKFPLFTVHLRHFLTLVSKTCAFFFIGK